MQVTKNKVVAFEYHLTDDDGAVIDSNMGGEPLEYLHGVGNIIEGLEEALDGKSTGDKFSVSVSPEKGYGPKLDELVGEVPRDEFENPEELEVGMEFDTYIPEEDTYTRVCILEISGDTVTIDANHELAGKNLHFEIQVGAIRDATPQEIEHGHAHMNGEDHD